MRNAFLVAAREYGENARTKGFWVNLLMFPILLVMYARLSITEETEMRAQFGEVFERYAQRTPRFVPHLSGPEVPHSHLAERAGAPGRRGLHVDIEDDERITVDLNAKPALEVAGRDHGGQIYPTAP